MEALSSPAPALSITGLSTYTYGSASHDPLAIRQPRNVLSATHASRVHHVHRPQAKNRLNHTTRGRVICMNMYLLQTKTLMSTVPAWRHNNAPDKPMSSDPKMVRCKPDSAVNFSTCDCIVTKEKLRTKKRKRTLPPSTPNGKHFAGMSSAVRYHADTPRSVSIVQEKHDQEKKVSKPQTYNKPAISPPSFVAVPPTPHGQSVAVL